MFGNNEEVKLHYRRVFYMDAQTRHLFDSSKLPAVYHPGDTLDEKLQEMGMEVKEFAMRVSIPEEVIRVH